jgi:uncharacterized protein (DUF342 family)
MIEDYTKNLQTLFQKWRGGATASLTDLVTSDGTEVSEDCWDSLDSKAEALLAQLANPANPPVNGTFELIVSADSAVAWALSFPPFNHGEPATWEQAQKALAAQSVTNGLIDGSLEHALTNPLQLTLLAKGSTPVHATDGYVEYLIDIPEKARLVKIAETASETTDFKNLNWLVSVNEGDTLCVIHPPTEPVDGISVRGVVLNGRKGRLAVPPQGKNTELVDEGARLIATIGGTIKQIMGKLSVENTVVIDGDVDFSTGNLTVQGSILIRGAVRNGFRVEATGNITVQQMVEDAMLFAGGDIVIEYGMNGNSRGTLRADGNIRCKFLEHTNVFCKGDVMLGSAVNCTIESGGEVLVLFTPGCIIGGTITSMKKIEARSVGAESRFIPTQLMIACLPNVAQEKQRLTDESEAEQQKLAPIEDMLSKLTDVPPDKVQIVQELKTQQSALKMKLIRLGALLQGIKAQEEYMLTQGVVLMGVAYPGVRVNINGARRNFDDNAYNCRLFKHEGEIVVGIKK